MISELDVGSSRPVATQGHSFSDQLVVFYGDLKVLVGSSHLIAYGRCHSPDLLVLTGSTTVLNGVEAGIRRIRRNFLHLARAVYTPTRPDS